MTSYEILLGPILGYEWDAEREQSLYTVIARVKDGTAPTWVVGSQTISMTPISDAFKDKSRVWRGEVALTPFAADAVLHAIPYSIKRSNVSLKNILGVTKWTFHLPPKSTPAQQPRIAFCSCNGFTDSNALRGTNPLALWERMAVEHQKAPFSLLLMGGDQLYCDDLARKEGSVSQIWAWLTHGEKPKNETTAPEFLHAYLDHYLTTWVRIVQDPHEYAHTAMVQMMASVPSVMMWDDHDIFDGWGSYQASDRKQPYYKLAFDAARKAFETYQIRGESANRSLLDRKVARPRHYTQALKFGSYDILMMDNRSHRTPERVMDTNQWNQILNWLQATRPSVAPDVKSTLLVVSPVPVVYRRFHDWVSELPGEHGGEDDLRDHWSHHLHEGERDRLVYHLFKALKYNGNNAGKYDRVTILSGDVHVGALGFLERTDEQAEIAQVISSAIMHPPPGVLIWEGLKVISSDEEHGIKGQSVTARMTRPVGAKDRYLRCRNFTWLKEGDDGKLWVNWECENVDGKTPELVEFGLR